MKKFFKNLSDMLRKRKLKIASLVFIFFSFSLLMPEPARAIAPLVVGAGVVAGGLLMPSMFGGILGSVIAWIVYVINYIIATIFGVFISIIAWFIGIVIQINTNIVNTPIVQNGFSITLAVANLGFVLAIIVIAIMTILRYETYALKKTLWKLVAAAILVNFSLVIAGAILNFADNLTLYFLNGFNQGCTTGTSTGVPGFTNSPFDCFATSVAGAFAPQRVFLTPSNIGGLFDQSRFQGAAGAGQSFGGVITPLLNIFFPTLFMIIAVIALFGLFIMLLIRYIYLGILLILMPLAWLLWIFPVTSNQWHKWWSKFIQWTIFAPVVMFFIYLSVLSLGVNNNSNPDAFLAALRVQSDSNSVLVQGISNFLGNAAATPLGTMLQMAIMVSLLFAGLYMAQAMGIMFADTTLKGAKYVTSSFGRFASRRGVIGAGWAINKTPIPKWTAALQRGVGAKPQGLLAKAYKYSGAEYAGQKLGYGIHAVHVATREGTIEEAKKRVAGMENRELIGLLPGGTDPEKIAIINELSKRDALDMANMDYTHKKEIKELFANYGMSKDYEKNVEKKSGVSSEMYEAAKRGDPQKDIDALAATFAEKFSRAEVGAMQVSDLHSRKAGNFGLDAATITKLAKANAYGFAAAAPQFASSILSRTKSDSLDNFANDYRDGLVNAESRGVISTGEYTKRDDSFKTNLTNNMMGFTPMTGSAGGGTPGGGTPPPTPGP